MKIKIILISALSFFLQSFAFAGSEDEHKSEVNNALASYLMVFFDNGLGSSDGNYKGDSLVSKQEYENCFIPLKKSIIESIERGERLDYSKLQELAYDDCANNVLYLTSLSSPNREYLRASQFNKVKEEAIKNLDLWDFDFIDTNIDGYIETNEFYNHLMEGNPHSFYDPRKLGITYEVLAHSIELPGIEKAIEYQWRQKTIIWNDSDNFMSEILQSRHEINQYDLNFDGSVDYSEFRSAAYVENYLKFVDGNDSFQDEADEWEERYLSKLSEYGLASEKNSYSQSACANMSEYEAELLINTVNSFGYNFDLYDIQSCMYFNPRGFINFNSTDKTIYFDTNVAFFIRSTYGGTGVCLSPALGAYETSSQDECFN